MQLMKTSGCICCGKPATYWHGHVIGRRQTILSNLMPEKIIAGFCNEHQFMESQNTLGCYGLYDSMKHGGLVPMITN